MSGMPGRKLVKIRCSFTSVEEVPADWDAEDILFYFNDSSSCMNNRLHLRLKRDEDDCTCAEGVVELLENPAVEEP